MSILLNEQVPLGLREVQVLTRRICCGPGAVSDISDIGVVPGPVRDVQDVGPPIHTSLSGGACGRITHRLV